VFRCPRCFNVFGRVLVGVVTTYAGQALKSSLTNGLGTSSLFQGPASIAVASNLTIYVADNYYIRQISSAGTVSTFECS
jgi:hypothetical protein